MSMRKNSLRDLLVDDKDWDGILERLKTDDGREEARKTMYRKLPLHYASQVQPPLEVVEALLDAYPEGGNMANKGGWLPIHYACRFGGSIDVVKALLKANPEGIRKVDEYGRLPLHYALAEGATDEVLKQLLLAYPEGTRNIEKEGMLPIHLIQRKNASPERVRLILKAYAGKADRKGTQRLHASIQSGSKFDVWRVLIGLYPQGAAKVDAAGRNPLHIVIDDGAPPEVVLALTAAYPDAATTADREGKLPLHHYVCKEGANLEVVVSLLEAYPAGIMTPDNERKLPLHVINENASDELLAALVKPYREALWQDLPEGYESKKIEDGKEYPKFRNAEDNFHVPILELSVGKIIYVHSSDEEHLPLQHALKSNAPSTVIQKLLNDYPIGGFYPDKYRRLPLHCAFLYGAKREVSEAILRSCRDATTWIDREWKLPLHYACGEGVMPDMVREVLHANPKSVSRVDKDGRLPLHHACTKKPRAETIDMLLQKHPEGAAIVDVNDNLPIHLLFRSDGFNKDREGNEGEDSSDVEARGNLSSSMEKLLQGMMNDNDACSAVGGDVGVFLPLHIASSCNVSTDIFESLLCTYPEAASRVNKVPGRTNRFALDLLEDNRQAVLKAGRDVVLVRGAEDSIPKSGGVQIPLEDDWRHNFNLKSDLLFSFNPNVPQSKGGPERIRRLEQRIIDEMHENEKELSEVSRRVWVWMCESDLTASVKRILDNLNKNACETLALIQSRTGHRLLVGASPECGRIIRSHLLFIGRYHIRKNERPLHQSDTCLVMRATDYGSPTGDASRECFDLIVSASDPVVIKFMFHKEQFEREKSARVDLGLTEAKSLQTYHAEEEFPPLVPIVAEYDIFRKEECDIRFKCDRDQMSDLAEFGHLNLKAYNFALVMPEAEQTLDDIYKHERPSTNKVRQVMEEVACALEKLHQRGIIHGDLKLLNVVRIKGHISLIDMDGSCRTDKHKDHDETRDFAGEKFSSGILPPEMVACLGEEGICAYEKYWKSEFCIDSNLWKKIKPSLRPGGTEAFVIKTLKGLTDGLPYKPVHASPKIDIWSFGALLLQLSCGDPLFRVNRDDDLMSVKDFQNLYSWDKSKFEEVVDGRIEDLLLKDLLGKLLLVKAECRPDSISEVLEHPFFKAVDDPLEAQGKLGLLKAQVDRQAEEDKKRCHKAWEELSTGSGSEETLQVLSGFAAQYQAIPYQPDWISTLDDLVEDAKACEQDLHDAMRAIVEEAGGTFKEGPLKQKARIMFKTENEYGGEFRRVVDVVRGTAVFDSLSQTKKIFDVLNNSSRLAPIRCKDRFNNPLPSGYRDILVNVVQRRNRASAHVAELQIHLKPLRDIKEINHRVYELQRIAGWVP